MDELIYCGEKLLGVSGGVIYDVRVVFCACKFEGYGIGFLVLSIGYFVHCESRGFETSLEDAARCFHFVQLAGEPGC